MPSSNSTQQHERCVVASRIRVRVVFCTSAALLRENVDEGPASARLLGEVVACFQATNVRGVKDCLASTPCPPRPAVASVLSPSRAAATHDAPVRRGDACSPPWLACSLRRENRDARAGWTVEDGRRGGVERRATAEASGFLIGASASRRSVVRSIVLTPLLQRCRRCYRRRRTLYYDCRRAATGPVESTQGGQGSTSKTRSSTVQMSTKSTLKTIRAKLSSDEPEGALYEATQLLKSIGDKDPEAPTV